MLTRQVPTTCNCVLAIHRRRTRDDATATIVTQRVVNTYSRAQPRQAINKHHFLTPDTPYELKYELPSHLLQGSESSSTTSQAYSEEKPALKSALKGKAATVNHYFPW